MPSNILVVEDEPAISELISVNLQHAGHCPIRAYNAEQAQNLISDVLPDLVLLDWMLPGKSGIAFARDLRNNERTKHIPIIMLTARGEEIDRVLGLEMGADDYVTKPFSPRELVARVRAVLRRHSESGDDKSDNAFAVGQIMLDPDKYEVTVRGDLIDLTPREFELLHYLMKHMDRVVSRDQLLDRVWGYEYAGDTRLVDVHISHLRDKIEEDPKAPRHIKTVRGVGYKIVRGE